MGTAVVRRGDPLDPREVEVLELLVDGRDGDQIAARLNLYPSTVWRRFQKARIKLGADTLYQLAVKYDRTRR